MLHFLGSSVFKFNNLETKINSKFQTNILCQTSANCYTCLSKRQYSPSVIIALDVKLQIYHWNKTSETGSLPKLVTIVSRRKCLVQEAASGLNTPMLHVMLTHYVALAIVLPRIFFEGIVEGGAWQAEWEQKSETAEFKPIFSLVRIQCIISNTIIPLPHFTT